MLAEACNLADPDTAASLQSTYHIHGRISSKGWRREEKPTEYNEIPLSVFMDFIAQYMWGAYGFKTWTPNKFHQAYKNVIFHCIIFHISFRILVCPQAISEYAIGEKYSYAEMHWPLVATPQHLLAQYGALW
jgi:hypothetical protein